MTPALTRRTFLGAAGALTVSVGLPGAEAHAASFGAEARPPLDPVNLSSFVSINADGSAICYFGKIDGGQGTDLGVCQMVAEELDLPIERVMVLEGDSGTSVNQGGASGSTGIERGGKALASAAAEARHQLVVMAAQQLGVPAEQLVTADGIVSVKDDPKRKVSYSDLIGGRFFDTQLEWNKKWGNDLFVKGAGKRKDPKDYKVIGTSPRRRDIVWKILGTGDYVVDIKLPGMLHARMLRPPAAGAEPVSVDETSVKDIPGVRIVREKGLLAVAASREWDAVKAARQLRVTWSEPKPAFVGNAGLYGFIRNAAVLKKDAKSQGDVDAAFAGAARVIEAEYEWPYQSHSSMGPACAVADYKADGLTTVWTSTQKPHFARESVAAVLGVPVDKVRSIWTPGPGSYGRNDAGDAVTDAAYLSKALGAPVRVQGMRYEGTGWDPKCPASVHTARAALDKDGTVLAWDFVSRGFSRTEIDFKEANIGDTLTGMMLGLPVMSNPPKFNLPEESYGFGAKRKSWEVIAPQLARASPLRCAHMRDPVGPQIHFASESFMDELAFAVAMDPVDFRLKYLQEARDLAVVTAVADRAGWQKRTAPRKVVDGDVLKGQGFAYAQRAGTRVAVIADVEIDRRTGKARARRITVAHDCGLIINPGTLHQTIEGAVVQGCSRAFFEEVKFDDRTVMSVDWVSYPIVEIGDAPETIDIVLIDHPEVEPTGAGEAAQRPLAAAIANAIFDATGTRLRQAPFTPERLKRTFS